jgi:hypothetical protein
VPIKPYKITCEKCKLEFYSESSNTKYCKKCKKEKLGVKKLPKIFYKNRKIVLERDEHKCQCCGCEITNNLAIHFIDCDFNNCSISNLITMCKTCCESLLKKYSKYILRRSSIYKLFSQEKQFGEEGKTVIYQSAKKIVKKQFGGKPKLFFKSKK